VCEPEAAPLRGPRGCGRFFWVDLFLLLSFLLVSSERRAAELEARLGGRSFLFSNDGADSYAVLTPPRFDLADEEAAAAAMSYLDEFGYLVVAAAAPPAALQRLRSLLWLELEALGRGIVMSSRHTFSKPRTKRPACQTELAVQ
jgi:hypothetical protein